MTRRVLVADDDEMTRKVLSTVLDLEEYDVVLVADGDQALVALHAGGFDAVVLDHMMPGLTGLEVLARMRRQEDTADLPVVLLTAATRESLEQDPIEAGAQAYLAKPFSPLHLIEVLEDIVGGAR